MNIQEFATAVGISSDLTELEIVFTYLKNEYGYVLPQLEKVSKVEIKEINLEELNLNSDRITSLQKENLLSYSNNPLPIIVLKRNQLFLIDGYHRVANSLLEKRLLYLAIILS